MCPANTFAPAGRDRPRDGSVSGTSNGVVDIPGTGADGGSGPGHGGVAWIRGLRLGDVVPAVAAEGVCRCADVQAI